MAKVSTTRMELLIRKEQLALTTRARDVLEEKRTALIQEIMRVADTVLEQSEVLEGAAAQARRALIRAEATAGVEGVRSAALATRRVFSLHIQETNVMGVNVPLIEQTRLKSSALERGYAVTGTSLTIDEAVSAFEAVVETILRVADSELRLARLLEEARRTTRRLNALEHLVIPQLKAERDYIQMALDERERSTNYRLKLAKRLLERKC